jgi:hypothetical protein
MGPGLQMLQIQGYQHDPYYQGICLDLEFPNWRMMYFRQRIKDMTTKVIKLLHLDQVAQYRTTNDGFKWKLIETKLKANKDGGELREERYQAVASNIFGLVLFPWEDVGIISVKATNAFIYEQTRNNPTITILAKTFLSLNHCRLHVKGAIWCCITWLFI